MPHDGVAQMPTQRPSGQLYAEAGAPGRSTPGQRCAIDGNDEFSAFNLRIFRRAPTGARLSHTLNRLLHTRQRRQPWRSSVDQRASGQAMC